MGVSSTRSDTDYYGQSRIFNDYADMGAVEYSGVQDCEDCDFNRSAAVDFSDFHYIANSWLAVSSDPRYSLAFDLFPDGIIDEWDLLEFSDCWLWEPPFILTQEVTQIAHRSTGLFAIEPETLPFEGSFEVLAMEQTEQGQTYRQPPQISPL